MSILIKDMEMPKDCVSCRWHARWGCEITHLVTNVAQRCPLVEIPTPHGRLIDADALYEQTAEWEAKALAQVEKHDPRVENETRGWAHWSVVLVERTAFKHDLMDAPTIIEAEEE